MRTAPTLLTAATFGAALILEACDDDPVRPPAACTDQVAVSVSAGTSPTFAWTPACGVAILRILKPPSLDAYPDAWTIRAPNAQIGPPVRYGDTPSGSTEDRPAESLIAGQNYRAFVFDASGSSLGTTQFTP